RAHREGRARLGREAPDDVPHPARDLAAMAGEEHHARRRVGRPAPAERARLELEAWRTRQRKVDADPCPCRRISEEFLLGGTLRAEDHVGPDPLERRRLARRAAPCGGRRPDVVVRDVYGGTEVVTEFTRLPAARRRLARPERLLDERIGEPAALQRQL